MLDISGFRSGEVTGARRPVQGSQRPLRLDDLLFHADSLALLMRRPPPRGFSAISQGVSRDQVASWQRLTGAAGTFSRGGSCAVVGNSGALQSQDDGALIDAHDQVIRFNDAPTKGHEAFVGSRTSIRLWVMPEEGPFSLPWRAWGEEKLLCVAKKQSVVRN